MYKNSDSYKINSMFKITIIAEPGKSLVNLVKYFKNRCLSLEFILLGL